MRNTTFLVQVLPILTICLCAVFFIIYKIPSRAKSQAKIHVESGKSSSGIISRIDKNGISVGCGEGRLLILRVKPEGKKVMDAFSFANGQHLQIGDTFE